MTNNQFFHLLTLSNQQQLSFENLEFHELKIEDLIVGEGKQISKGALCYAHYRGYLKSGEEFENSFERNGNTGFKFVFGTGRVIKGWDLGLIGMKVGGVRRLIIPSSLAYGERKVGEKIQPHSDLVFEVELLEVLTRD